MSRERGFALLMVLWTMGLLALLVAQFIATGRTEVRVAANFRANAVTQAAADGALYEAILRLLKGTWVPDGRPRRICASAIPMVEVRVKDQSWKVNPNAASLPVLQASAGQSRGGSRQGRRARAARSSNGGRPPRSRRAGGPSRRGLRRRSAATGGSSDAAPAWLSAPAGRKLFDSLDDIALVPGMTPALLARMRPFLSVYQEADALETSDALPTGVA